MATLTEPTDNAGAFEQPSIFAAPREILTRANAAENGTAGEMSKFACPRCGADAVERFYGPCGRCRAELRGESAPAPARARQRAPERPWRVLGAGVEPVRHLGELAERFAGVGAVWLTRPALAALGLPAELENRAGQAHELVELARADGWGFRDGLRSTTGLWREAVRLDVVVPAWDRSSPWHAVDDAGELDAALERFWRLVGVPYAYSGAITSDALLRELTSRPRGLRIRPAVVPAELTGRRGEPIELERDWVWARPALDTEQSARFAIALDVNGAYLGASSSLALPAGEPEHRVGTLAIDTKAPGVWLIEPPAPRDGWPDPFRPAELRGEPTELWVTTPTAALAGELGVTARQAFVWPEHHRFLDGWYKTLRDARSTLLDAGASAGGGVVSDALALAAVKATYRQGIGRLGSTRRTRANDNALYQPLWRALVIGTARARIARALAKAPRPPFAIGTDCAWWFTEHDSPAELAAELGLELSNKLGKYKPAGVIAGETARELTSAGAPAWRVIAQLRESAKP